MDMKVGLWRKLSAKELMLLNCDVGKDSCKFLGLQGDPTSPSWRRPVLGIHWKDWCWGWNSNTLATSCEKLTHWKRPWCWEGLGGRRRKGRQRTRWLDGITDSMHEFGWTLGVGDGQGGLVCCDWWGRKESDTTEWLNWGGASGKEPVCQCRQYRRCEFDPWVRKILW